MSLYMLSWEELGEEYLYHGTTRRALEVALASGGTLKGPSWWGTERVADYYAEVAAEEEGPEGEEAIVRVPLSRFNRRLLKPDHNSIAEPLTYTLGADEKDLWRQWQKARGTWRDCLEIYESVRYEAPLRIAEEDAL
jgi:hypothetical protein